MSVLEFLDPKDWLFTDGGPRYMQLRNRVSKGIVGGVLAPSTPLPSEREIAQITDMSRVTVRKAFQSLIADGLIVQKQGSGSFVADKELKIDQNLSRLTSFSEDMDRRGMASTMKWLERGVFMPSPDELLILALPADASVARISRLRFADDQPMAIEKASLSTEFLPNPMEIENSLYDHLELTGHRPVRAMQKISAINLDSISADLLNVEEGAAGLKIERMSYLEDGQIVEFTQSIYRGDAYNFVAELRLAGD
jgi:GntR family transcriptional regulator